MTTMTFPQNGFIITYQLTVIGVIFHSVYASNIIRDSCMKYGIFYHIGEGYRFKGGLIKAVIVNNQGKCLAECLDNEYCKAINFYNGNRNPTGSKRRLTNCNLLKQDLQEVPNGLHRSEVWSYLETGKPKKLLGRYCNAHAELCPQECRCFDSCQGKLYTCDCSEAITSKNTNYSVANFPPNATNNLFISWGTLIKHTLTEYTTCLWFKPELTTFLPYTEQSIFGYRPPAKLFKNKILFPPDKCGFFNFKVFKTEVMFTLWEQPIRVPFISKPTWQHVCMTQSVDNRVGVYIDGVMVKQTDPMMFPVLPFDGDLLIGNSYSPGKSQDCGRYTPENAYRGSVTDMNLWQRRLSEDEIKRVRFLGEQPEGLMSSWEQILAGGKFYEGAFKTTLETKYIFTDGKH